MKEEKARELLRISELVTKFKQGGISPAEEQELGDWLAKSPHNRELLDDLQNESLQSKELSRFSGYNTETALNRTLEQIRSSKAKTLFIQRFLRGAAAAVLLATAGVIFYHSTSHTSLEQAANANHITPAGNKAVLVLANGVRIHPDQLLRDTVIPGNSLRIKKAGDGKVTFEVISNGIQKETGQIAWNTLQTPPGGKYQVLLPDGTKIWLNAASYIRFPDRFTSTKREVEAGGEVYFEVATQKNPFIVHTAQQAVEVLGTRFNINAYNDEAGSRTTLLDGKVKVSGSRTVILKPGQQAAEDKGVTNVSEVNTEAVTAWRNGLFQFSEEPLESIMRQVARWYNVDIEYEENMGSQRFSGTVSRYSNVAEVLRIMEETGAVHFTIKGRRIIVSR